MVPRRDKSEERIIVSSLLNTRNIVVAHRQLKPERNARAAMGCHVVAIVSRPLRIDWEKNPLILTMTATQESIATVIEAWMIAGIDITSRKLDTKPLHRSRSHEATTRNGNRKTKTMPSQRKFTVAKKSSSPEATTRNGNSKRKMTTEKMEPIKAMTLANQVLTAEKTEPTAGRPVAARKATAGITAHSTAIVTARIARRAIVTIKEIIVKGKKVVILFEKNKL